MEAPQRRDRCTARTRTRRSHAYKLAEHAHHPQAITNAGADLLELLPPAKNITPFLRRFCAGQALLFMSPDCREGSEFEEWKGEYTCRNA